MTITPGYDFTVNEVPTRRTLELMTAGMSITGIDISNISATLVGTKRGDTSTSLPAEGWLLYDAPGGLWVQTGWGRVHLWRGCWGGYETNRLAVAGQAGSLLRPVTISGLSPNIPSGSAASAESAIQWEAVNPGGTQKCIMKNLDTCVSAGHARVVMWGGGAGWLFNTLFHTVPGTWLAQAASLNDPRSVPASVAANSSLGMWGVLLYDYRPTTNSTRVPIIWNYGHCIRQL